MKRIVALSALLLGGGCAPRALTEVVIVVHTTYEVPTALDGVRITSTRPGTSATTSMGAWSDASEPRMLGLVHEGGALGPIDVAVVGMLGAAELVERRATFSFVPGEVRRLDLWLVPECAAGIEPCRGTETCDPGPTCREPAVAPSELSPWPGSDPAIDAGTGLDVGTGLDAGAGFDAGPSGGHDAGACCPATAPSVREVACESGTCVIVECEPATLHCDTNLNNGCEVRADSRTDCGACGRRCTAGMTCTAVGAGFECR